MSLVDIKLVQPAGMVMIEEENIDDSKSKRILCHLNGLNEKEIEFFISVIQAYKNIK